LHIFVNGKTKTNKGNIKKSKKTIKLKRPDCARETKQKLEKKAKDQE